MQCLLSLESIPYSSTYPRICTWHIVGTPLLFVEHTTQNKRWLEELEKPTLFSQMEILREKWRLGAGTAEMDSAAGNSWTSEAGQTQRELLCVLGQARTAISGVLQEGMQVLQQVLAYRAPGKHYGRWSQAGLQQ